MKGLISGYLEHIASSVFDEYHKEITKLIGKEHGVYALYKKNRLYYVGLATNLKSRVKQHLKGKHAKKWDSFSLYLIRKTEHLKELEALVTRIAEPKGNIQRGKFTRAQKLHRLLEKMTKESDKQRRENIFIKSKKKKTFSSKSRKRASRKPRIPALKSLLPSGAQLKRTYKGQEHIATIEADGQINLNGKLYNSPSSAAQSVLTAGAVNGWIFWRYQNSEGKWVELDALRKKLPAK